MFKWSKLFRSLLILSVVGSLVVGLAQDDSDDDAVEITRKLKVLRASFRVT